MEKYGSVYKQLRKQSNKTTAEVVEELKAMGINITISALYNYENNIRAASADILLALCRIYDCRNILEAFTGIEPDYSKPTDEEWHLIEKFRALDARGQNNVQELLDREYSYTEEAKKGSKEEDFA